MIGLILAFTSLVLAAVQVDFEGKVVGITDGDTITVLVGTDPVKVRLNGIDAPEKKQPFGTQSRAKLGELAFGKTVTVHSAGKDRYGRTLGTVLADGQSVNLKMVETGLAWHYAQYSKDAALADAEKAARAARRGLWADPKPVAPWEFRKAKTPAKKAA